MNITSRLRGFFSNHAPRASAMFRRRSSTTRTAATVHTLPDELLLHIFSTIANDPTTNPVTISIITHVCTHWRQIAIADGSLWTRIILTFPVYPRHISFVVACLARSANYPLNILLDFRDPAWDWNEDTHSFRWQDMEPILRLLLVHVQRWRRFDLLTDTWLPIFTFLWYTRRVESAPMLETLSLSRCNLYLAARGQIFQPVSLRQPIQLFGGIALQRLRSVSLIGVHIDWKQPSLRNLTHLELKYQASDVMPTLEQFESIFNACPCLLRLAIYGWGPILDPSTPLQRARLCLPNLATFSFGFLHVPYSLRLLSLLSFPSLKELVLEDVSRVVTPIDVLDASPLIHWLASPNQPTTNQSTAPFPLHRLHSVELHGTRCRAAEMASFFHRLASLIRLGFYDTSDDLLCLLIPPSNIYHQGDMGQGSLCPQLRELHCQDMDPDAVINVLSSRAAMRSLPPLQKASIDFVRKSSPSLDSPTHTRLINAGIEIQGKSGSDSSESGSPTSV
ncbi:hypothetical protein BDZ97DRAFT_201055 [Flammula alnicola]|nr:hypothetical protein BDZ97DRAFT_201055 [Flammula alnicola]